MGAYTSIKTLMASPTQIPSIAEMIENDFRQDGFEVTSQTSVTGELTLVMNKKGFLRSFFGLDQRLYVKMNASGDKTYFEARSNILVKAIVYLVILTIAELLLPFLAPLFFAMEVTYIVGLVKQAKLDNRALAISEKFETFSPVTVVAAETATQTVFCTTCGKSVPAGNKFCPECGAEL